MGGGGTARVYVGHNADNSIIVQLVCELEKYLIQNKKITASYDGLEECYEELKDEHQLVIQENQDLKAERQAMVQLWDKKTKENEAVIAQMKESFAKENKEKEIRLNEKDKLLYQYQEKLNEAKLANKEMVEADLKSQRRYEERLKSVHMAKDDAIKKISHARDLAENKLSEECQVLRNHLKASDAALACQMVESKKLGMEVNRLNRLVAEMKKGSSGNVVHTKVGPPERTQQKVVEMVKELNILRPRCKDAERMIHDRDSAVKQLSARLSAEMSKKVSADEKCLENINIKNRPINIAVEFEHLCSTEWLDAKQVLDNVLSETSEKAKASFLCEVLCVTEKHAEERIAAFNSRLFQLFNSPVNLSDNCTMTKQLPVELTNLSGDLLRRTADKIDISFLVQITKSTLAKEFGFAEAVVELDGVQKYIEACARLVWKMVIQRPGMRFRRDGVGEPWKGTNIQDVCFNSIDPKHVDSKVDYYVHPSLLHGDVLMVKGRVHLS